MPPERLSAPSHLFTVRLWSEELGHGNTEWRGKVTHVLSGEAGYFRAWPALLDFLSGVLAEYEPTSGKRVNES